MNLDRRRKQRRSGHDRRRDPTPARGERRRGERRNGDRRQHPPPAWMVPIPSLESREARLCLLYVFAVMLSVGISGQLGPTASVVTSFLGIGLALIIRDRLHDMWEPNPWDKMTMLIVGASVGSLLLNLNQPVVALASFLAFTSAEGADAVTYHLFRRHGWVSRVTASNIMFAIWDSVVFAPIAFGYWNSTLVIAQIAAKILGSSIYLYAFRRRFIAFDRRNANRRGTKVRTTV